MKHLLSTLLVVASVASLSQAQEAKVIKVKGQQAIVQFPNGTAPVVGEMIPVGGEAKTEDGGHRARGSRDHLLALAGEIDFTNNSATSTSTTTFNIQGRYGWNQEIFEFGPLAGFLYTSTNGLSTRTIYGGGFLDFNFVPNKPGNDFIYGVGVTGDFSQGTTSVSNGSDQTTSYFELFAGGNIKYFGLSENVALRADAGFDFKKNSGLNGQSSNDVGLKILAGIAFYY